METTAKLLLTFGAALGWGFITGALFGVPMGPILAFIGGGLIGWFGSKWAFAK